MGVVVVTENYSETTSPFDPLSVRRLLKSVPHPPHRFYKGVFAPLDLGPEPADMDIHGPVAAVVVIAPDLIEQGLTGKDPAAVGGKEYQEPVFREGEGEGLTRERRLPAREVDHQIVVADHVFAVNGIRLLEEFFDPEGYLFNCARFNDKIIYGKEDVCALIQGILGNEGQDGDWSFSPQLPDCFDDGRDSEGVFQGEDDEVRGLVSYLLVHGFMRRYVVTGDVPCSQLGCYRAPLLGIFRDEDGFKQCCTILKGFKRSGIPPYHLDIFIDGVSYYDTGFK